MHSTLQTFLADATLKSAQALETALNRLPEERRNWSPEKGARTALDMVAECAMLNDTTVGMLDTHSFPENYDMDRYMREKAALIENPAELLKLLRTNTAKVIEKIKNVPDSDLDVTVPVPWGSYSVAEVAAYPYWNMSYHEGQINYLASMLGCLD